MAGPNGTSSFSKQVQAHLVEKGISVRELARRMNPEQPEQARRNLNRWLHSGIRPTAPSRVAVAVALGLPEDSLSDDDDEEDPELMRALLELVRVLRAPKEQVT